MTDPIKNSDVLKSSTNSIENLHRFSYDAMATTFEILIVHKDRPYAGSAAQTTFVELDRLESELSRFVENSDVTRINNAPANQPVKVGLDTFECLKRCIEISHRTNGAFDVTIGSLLKCRLGENRKLLSPAREQIDEARKHTGVHLLKLNDSDYTVTVTDTAVQIDLGGFAKGYAVEKIADTLADWDIDTVFINAGSSTVFALNAPPDKKGWPVTITSPTTSKQLRKLHLENQALSGSGLEHGPHIIEPRTAGLIEDKIAAWSLAKAPADADALSTCFMVMSSEEIKNYCRKYPDVSAMIETKRAEILRFGKW